MVLLHGLAQLSKEHGWKLVVAHFNHLLRGRSSDADERFVRESAKCLKILFVAGRADVKRIAREKKLSIEMAARQLRHDFLARTARRTTAGTVALAHHANDQVELFFLRLLRGTGAEGLAGMKWRAPSPSDARVVLVRPLLGCPRAEILEFARAHEIRYREDATNATLDFLRNRVRHELLPLLVGHYQPALEKTILRLMEVLQAESEFVGQASTTWLEKRETTFYSLPVAVQRRAIQLQLFRLGVNGNFDLLEHLRLKPRRPVTLSPNCAIFRDEAGTVQTLASAKPGVDTDRGEVKLNRKSGRIRFGRVEINWKLALHNGPTRPAQHLRSQAIPSMGCESFDADKVGATIALRHWQPGDRFQPIGMHANAKLQDLFTNLKVPRPQRHELTVGTTDGGEVFWVQGLRISERFKLDKKTQRRLIWEWKVIESY